jgi:hypothetical protein
VIVNVLGDQDVAGCVSSSGASGRRARRVVAVLAAAGLLFAVCAIGAPDRAQAWAWKDTSVFSLQNETGSMGSVRPILYVGAPPAPLSEAFYLQLAATGVPEVPVISNLINSGYPLPTFGCVAALQVSNPGANAKCTAFAPSSGKNIFTCSGNVSTKIYQDNDDIKGYVIFHPSPTAVDRAFMRPFANPFARTVAHLSSVTPRRGILRRRDLKGTGWRPARKLSDFGEFGQLVSTDSLPASCQDRHKQSEARARRTGASAFARRHGAQAAGVVNGVYLNAAKSRKTLNAALSRHSISCLARLLTSRRLHSRVSTRRRSATAWRLVIRRPGRRPAYLDVAGLRQGRANALALFISSGAPTRLNIERSALTAVARRLG